MSIVRIGKPGLVYVKVLNSVHWLLNEILITRIQNTLISNSCCIADAYLFKDMEQPSLICNYVAYVALSLSTGLMCFDFSCIFLIFLYYILRWGSFYFCHNLMGQNGKFSTGTSIVSILVTSISKFNASTLTVPDVYIVEM